MIGMVTTQRAIEMFVENTGIDAFKWKPLLKEWALWADRAIGTPYVNKRYCIKVQFKPQKQKSTGGFFVHIGPQEEHSNSPDVSIAMIPESVNTILDVSLDIFKPELLMANSVVSDGLLVIDNARIYNNNNVKWYINDNQLIITNPQKITHAYVLFSAYEMDEDGYPKVSEWAVPCIAAYLELRWAKREKWRSGRKFSRVDIQQMDMDYQDSIVIARSNIRKELGGSDEDRAKDILNNPLAGRNIGLPSQFDFPYWT